MLKGIRCHFLIFVYNSLHSSVQNNIENLQLLSSGYEFHIWIFLHYTLLMKQSS
jgi:hypothetical protein